MGVLTEYQVVIQCDFCFESDVYGWLTQKEAIQKARASGWAIGKKVRCPECRRKKEINPHF